MEQPLFECAYAETAAQETETARYLLLERPQNVLLRLADGLLAAAAVAFVYLQKRISGSVPPVSYALAALCLLTPLVRRVLIRIAERRYESDPDDAASAVQVRVAVTETGITVNRSGAPETALRFDEIAKVYERKTSLILYTAANASLTLPKDGFITGSAKDLKRFLKEKNKR